MPISTVDEFRQALGVSRSIRLGLTGPDGATSEVLIDSPCAVLGRSPDAQVILTDETVSFRQLYVQVLLDRVLCIDLFSANALSWEDGRTLPWACPMRPFRIGAYRLWVLPDGWQGEDPAMAQPLDWRTRQSGSSDFGLLPEVELRLLNKSLDGMHWPINRVITLVGRDDRCRITCTDDAVSKVHCALVLLPSGLWAVDLLGKGGTRVNDLTIRQARLDPGDVLQIGPYRMQARYLSTPAALPPAGAERVGFITRLHTCFKVEWDGDTLIVTPQGRAREFRFQDVQREASAIISVLKTTGFQNLLVDFSAVRLSGSLIIDSLTQFCRSTRGIAMLCNCSDEQRASLADLNLLQLWNVQPDRATALFALRQRPAQILATPAAAPAGPVPALAVGPVVSERAPAQATSVAAELGNAATTAAMSPPAPIGAHAEQHVGTEMPGAALQNIASPPTGGA